MKEAIICFELTMPNVGSWNGKFSGERNRYLKFIKLGRTKSAHDKASMIVSNPSHYYDFGDGWGSNVSMSIVDTKERNALAKQSAGFMGYDWMVNSIINHGKIQCD